MRYIKLIGVISILALLAACAPAAGRPAIPYLAEPQEVISAVAQFGPLIPAPSLHNHFSIETIGDSFITLRSDAVMGAQVLTALGGGSQSPPIRVTVTTLEQAGITNVAVSIIPPNNTTLYEAVVRELDTRFRRAPVHQ